MTQAQKEIDRLAKFLVSNYADEIGKGNPREGESAVDVAIRLLRKDKKAAPVNWEPINKMFTE